MDALVARPVLSRDDEPQLLVGEAEVGGRAYVVADRPEHELAFLGLEVGAAGAGERGDGDDGEDE